LTKTIIIPSADEQLCIAINKRSKQRDAVTVPENQKYAVVVLPLVSVVTQEDYPTLKAEIQDIAGIQSNVKLIVDGKTPDSIPEGKEMFLAVSCHLRVRDIPDEPPVEEQYSEEEPYYPPK
jgi:hypothetical protein